MSASMEKRKRIVLVTSLLGGGGSERVLVTMARWWSEHGADVVIVVLRSDPAIRDYDVPPGIEVRRLNLIGERNAWWSPSQLTRLVRLRRELKELRPDVVISFIDKLNVAVLLALTGTGIPVVATEHLAPWMNPLGAVWERLRRLTYRRATAVVSPTKGITEWLSARMRGNFVTLPYPAQIEIGDLSGVERRKVVMAVGRLVSQKGFDHLIDAFAQIAARVPEWAVEIAGEGPERAALTEQIQSSKLEDRVRLLGQVQDVAARLREAAIFVLPSRHEAFPMALCEAMAAGCGVIATDCPTGPREIMDGKGGELVEAGDRTQLAGSLEKMMRNPARCAELGLEAAARAREFTAGRVMPKWAGLIDGQVLAPR